MRRILCFFAGLVSLSLSSRAADPPQFMFQDGDRVVLIGDTLIERDQKYGYLETLLTLQNPDKTITFRNLGWSGDTVAGLSRARFGPPSEGEQHLKDHVLALKPTVVIVGYGMADSFDGEAGLPRFVAGLNGLLDALALTKARFVLLSPVAHADLGRPLPDPKGHNKDLERYTEAIGKVAAERRATFVDTFHEWLGVTEDMPQLFSDDGIHLTDDGYWLFGAYVAQMLQGSPKPWTARFHHNGRLDRATGTTMTVDPAQPSGVHFTALDARLPLPPKQLKFEGAQMKLIETRLLVAEGLPDGSYSLTIDGTRFNVWKPTELATIAIGEKSIAAPDATRWAQGVEIRSGPEFDQVATLRRTINDKNLLYFHRWRPENETYLFGFRKHEQGNNAREIPLFDPLVEAKEKEIARLRQPMKHTYELIRETKPAE